MTNWERYFGTPEAAMRMDVRFESWPFMIEVHEAGRISSCTTKRRLLARFYAEDDYLEWLRAEHDDGTIRWDD